MNIELTAHIVSKVEKVIKEGYGEVTFKVQDGKVVHTEIKIGEKVTVTQ